MLASEISQLVTFAKGKGAAKEEKSEGPILIISDDCVSSVLRKSSILVAPMF